LALCRPATDEEIRRKSKPKIDLINSPPHYLSHPSGIEPIDFCEHLSFCTGNALKYLVRAEHKGSQIADLKKTVWYLNREAKRISNGGEVPWCDPLVQQLIEKVTDAEPRLLVREAVRAILASFTEDEGAPARLKAAAAFTEAEIARVEMASK
jgi:hypothetical protein